ncbi:MAG: hypothetical protein WCI67_21685 [Chloroflexales bacterium]
MRPRPFDLRSFMLILGPAVIGVAWAIYNLALAGALRDDSTVRPLVWVVFATPFAILLGWLAARPREMGLAFACCFSLYFFSFFVAQRIETLIQSPEQAAASGHNTYFWTMIGIHALAGAGLAIWRATGSSAALIERAP